MGLSFSKRTSQPQGVETASGKYCKLILTGCSGSGICNLVRQLAQQNYRVGTVVSTDVHRRETTSVVSEKAYFKLSPELMFSENNVDSMYGFTHHSFENCDAMVLEPSAVRFLQSKTQDPLLVVYVDISREKRIKKLVAHGWTDAEAYRITLKDRVRFQNFRDYDVRTTTSDIDIVSLCKDSWLWT